MRCYVSMTLTVVAALALGACGQKPPQESTVPEAKAPRSKKTPQTWNELGILDVGKIDGTFASLKDSLQKCVDRGNKFAAGNILYAMRIDHSGKAKWAFAKDSSIGDREVEKCMLDQLRSATWPVPEGGDEGLAEKPFEWPDREERPPVDWSTEEVLPAAQKIRSRLDACRAGNTGIFRATMIVETNGKVASVGMAPPDEKSEAVVDCLVGELKTLKLKSPGSWPARVSFDVP
ncbi:MAG TPA: hypothetical protein PLI95_20995 [Polyangiaceae bacterium]|nr:hypothetical protein [Polyangiaceae bacterium]